MQVRGRLGDGKVAGLSRMWEVGPLTELGVAVQREGMGIIGCCEAG